MQIAKMNKLTVKRKSDLGYMLEDGTDEVLLHFKEAKEEHNIGDTLEVFIYFDKKGRPCATENIPYVTLDHPGFLAVKDIVSNTGVFLDNNTGKDVLVSKDYLPYDRNLWPEVDDKLCVLLKVKSDTILAKPLNKYELQDLGIEKEYEINALIPAYVYKVGEQGVNLVTEDLVPVFVHKTMLRESLRVGQMVVVRIIHEAKVGYDGSLIGQKEAQIDPDKEIILKYLNESNGKMHLDAKSSSEEVEKRLNISRKAFKRALGGLYKEEKVYFEDGYTILKK